MWGNSNTIELLPLDFNVLTEHDNKYLCCDVDEPNLLGFNGEDATSPYSKARSRDGKSVEMDWST